MTDHARVLARLATAVAGNSTEGPLTWRLCHACQQLLGADGASITIDTSTLDHLTLAVTDPLAARLEDAQEVLGQGPGRDAYLTGRPVVTELDSAAELRWPMFVDVARKLTETLKIYAFPMRPGEDVLGVLTLFRQGGAELTEQLATAQFLSDAVGAALMRDPLSQADFGHGGAWSDRAEIHQAIGMVSAQLKVGAEDAIALLKAHAYAHDLDLGAVATLVTNRTLDFLGGV